MCESVSPDTAGAGEALVIRCEVDLQHGIAPFRGSLVAQFVRQEIMLVRFGIVFKTLQSSEVMTTTTSC